jgi:hypothetical protein
MMRMTFGSKLKSILARKLYRDERGQTNQMEITQVDTMICFTEVQFLRT